MNGVMLLYLKKEKNRTRNCNFSYFIFCNFRFFQSAILTNSNAHYNFQSYVFLVEEDRSVIWRRDILVLICLLLINTFELHWNFKHICNFYNHPIHKNKTSKEITSSKGSIYVATLFRWKRKILRHNIFVIKINKITIGYK